jgi:hypothetical protein
MRQDVRRKDALRPLIIQQLHCAGGKVSVINNKRNQARLR